MPRIDLLKRRKFSKARRISRIVVWSALVVVLFVRFVVLRDYYREFNAEQRRLAGRPNQQQDWRSRRPPTLVRPPVSPVPATLPRIQIEIAKRDVEKLRQYQWNGWRGQDQERPEVPATVREGATVYTNVALHLKGAAGSFRPFDDKPAVTLNFSKHAPKQLFHGYSKISLNNSVQDSTYICEIVSRELFEAAGVPVPRADHATVLINGRDLGLYVLTEGFGKPFLRRYFKDVRGNLYDGGFVRDIDSPLDTNSGDSPNDRSDLRRLIEAASESDATNRWTRLNQLLDMDRFIAFLAMEVMTCHWDGYGMNRNNYRVFRDLERDRMVFIPHGLDQMFGTFRSSPTSEILPVMQGLVAQAVLSTLPGRQQYLERIGSLRTNVFLEEKLTNRVHELARKIRPTLEAYGPDLAREHDSRVANLNRRIVERAQSISEQLSSMQSEGVPGFDFDVELRELQGLPPRAATRPEPMGRN